MDGFIMDRKIYKYKGAVHIHSLYSDGAGDIKSIARAAAKTGLDWILITDHNNFDAEEGIIEGVTVIKGEEISPKSCNHYLAAGIDKCIMPYDNIKETIEAVHRAGGFGFAAHPDESLHRKNPHKPIIWQDKNAAPDGVEIWNWFSSWADNYDASNIFTKAAAYIFKDMPDIKPNRETLEFWDKLNAGAGKIIPAIGGADAHALKIKGYVIPVTVFPYETLFKRVINEIHLDEPLSDDFKTRRNQIFSALKSGGNIIYNRRINPEAPEFYIKNSSRKAYAGESLRLDSCTYLHFSCSRKADIRIYKDGREFIKLKTDNSEIKIEKAGKYRLEAEIKGRGFAYTNPAAVLSADEPEGRLQK